MTKRDRQKPHPLKKKKPNTKHTYSRVFLFFVLFDASSLRQQMMGGHEMRSRVLFFLHG